MNERTIILAGAGALGLVAVVGFLAARRAGLTPGANTFNPLSRDNVFARGTDSLVNALSGGRHLGLGPAIFETFNAEPNLTAGVNVSPLRGYWGLFERSYYMPWLAREEITAAAINAANSPPEAQGWIVG